MGALVKCNCCHEWTKNAFALNMIGVVCEDCRIYLCSVGVMLELGNLGMRAPTSEDVKQPRFKI